MKIYVTKFLIAIVVVVVVDMLQSFGEIFWEHTDFFRPLDPAHLPSFILGKGKRERESDAVIGKEDSIQCLENQCVK